MKALWKKLKSFLGRHEHDWKFHTRKVHIRYARILEENKSEIHEVTHRKCMECGRLERVSITLNKDREDPRWVFLRYEDD